jgi:transposase
MDTSGSKLQEPAAPSKRSWRRHSAEFKARVIELARQPGTSVAAVALANGLNANMLRRWVHEYEAVESQSVHKDSAAALPAFVQLPVPPQERSVLTSPRPSTSLQGLSGITVEIRRGGTAVHASLPLDGRSAAWLREVLG